MGGALAAAGTIGSLIDPLAALSQSADAWPTAQLAPPMH